MTATSTVDLPSILRLDNPIRPYAWGSTTAIPDLLGIPRTGRPAAELWMGAHPEDPSHWAGYADRPRLDALIAADPDQLLGPAVASEFGRLPYLLKVVAAEKALSMQVHPDSEQAAAGFAAENERGVSPDSPERNYHDSDHKPELACAVTRFQAWCGFRPVADTQRFLDVLAVPELAPYRDLLDGEDGLRATFTTLLMLPDEPRATLIAATVAAAERVAEGGGEWADAAAATVLAASDFPGDIGAVLALLLNFLTLEPGEAIFLAAGNVHAYLRGTCVEIMANSDNVLRCALTSKHVDVPELMRIADFSPLAHPRWTPSSPAPGVSDFAVPLPDFELRRVELDGEQVEVAGDGPAIVLTLNGPVTVTAADQQGEILEQGQSAFIPAAATPIRLTGVGLAFVATPGQVNSKI